MLLVIEGNEGSGKTTLIDDLSKKLPFVRVKYPKEIKKTYSMLDFFCKEDTLYVLDRSFISDMVYRKLDHKKGQITLYQIGKLCGDNVSRLKIIFCHNDKAFENAMARGENVITTHSVHKLIDNEFASIKNIIRCFTDLSIMDYNYEYNSVDDVISFIKGGE